MTTDLTTSPETNATRASWCDALQTALNNAVDESDFREKLRTAFSGQLNRRQLQEATQEVFATGIKDYNLVGSTLASQTAAALSKEGKEASESEGHPESLSTMPRPFKNDESAILLEFLRGLKTRHRYCDLDRWFEARSRAPLSPEAQARVNLDVRELLHEIATTKNTPQELLRGIEAHADRLMRGSDLESAFSWPHDWPGPGQAELMSRGQAHLQIHGDLPDWIEKETAAYLASGEAEATSSVIQSHSGLVSSAAQGESPGRDEGREERTTLRCEHSLVKNWCQWNDQTVYMSPDACA